MKEKIVPGTGPDEWHRQTLALGKSAAGAEAASLMLVKPHLVGIVGAVRAMLALLRGDLVELRARVAAQDGEIEALRAEMGGRHGK